MNFKAEFCKIVAGVDSGRGESAETEVFPARIHLRINLRPHEFQKFLRLLARQDSLLKITAVERPKQTVEMPLRTQRFAFDFLTAVVDDRQLERLAESLRRAFGEGVENFRDVGCVHLFRLRGETAEKLQKSLEHADRGVAENAFLLRFRLLACTFGTGEKSGRTESQNACPVGRCVTDIKPGHEGSGLPVLRNTAPELLRKDRIGVLFNLFAELVEDSAVHLIGEAVERVDADPRFAHQAGERLCADGDQRSITVGPVVFKNLSLQQFGINSGIRIDARMLILVFQIRLEFFKCLLHTNLLAFLIQYTGFSKRECTKKQKTYLFEYLSIAFREMRTIF